MTKLFTFIVVMLLGGSVMAAPSAPTTKPASASGSASAAPAPTVPPPDFFWIGVWMQPPGDFKKWKDRGVNVIVTDRPKPDHKSNRDQYFAAAQAQGLKVVIYPDPENPMND